MTKKEVSIYLTASLPPVTDDHTIETHSATLSEAVDRLDHEATMLLEEARGRHQLHSTLNQVAERLR
ncbi:hypothetical protein [Phenylobacterium sp.]|uniref:hypothetical protein n=1 Tax=Phenylobacterium sp. TaxID=1871053 RepID=UPI00286B62F0|nr:hypothetical protein [Phenylobacterium sp.]